MEVLISMFIAMIGLMGVAAMIPVGHLEIVEGSKADYASGLGRAAWRDLKTRGAMNPASWARVSDGQPVSGMIPNTPAYPGFAFVAANSPLPVMVPVVLDPLGVANAFPNAFPVAGDLQIPRITLFSNTPATDPLAMARAEEMFRGGDDLLLNVPEDGDRQSTQLFSPTTGSSRRISAGEYSWLVTLVPNQAYFALSPVYEPTSNPLPIWHGNTEVMVTASIAVFYQRSLRTPVEACVEVVDMPGGGIGGGDVELKPTSTSPGGPYTVRPGQWLLLAGLPRDAESLAAAQIPQRYLDVKWYRVLAADGPNSDDAAADQAWRITLAGPDWRVLPKQSDGTVNKVRAWVVDGVLGVYEKNIRLEGASAWGR